MNNKRYAKKYRPRSVADFVGNEIQVEQLWSNIESRIPTLIHGPTGIGKTSSVYIVAEKLDRDVIERNASDKRRKKEIEELIRDFSSKSLNKIFGDKDSPVFLLDEVDGMSRRAQSRIVPIIKSAYHPVVLTANDKWKLIDDITETCDAIEYEKPRSDDIAERLKEISEREGIDVDFSKISRDVRASINAVLYGGEKLERVNIFNKLRDLFMGRDVDSIDDDDIPVWLIDNAPNFYEGRQLYEFYQFLSKVNMADDISLLNEMEKGHRGGLNYPRFFRRLKASKRGKKKK